MPNWCSNTLYVDGPSDALQRFRSHLVVEDGGFSVLNTFRPRPAVLADDWYQWSLDHWGTKWADEGSYFAPDLVDDDALAIRMETAWSPPCEAIRYISSLFRDLRFTLMYVEEGMWFMGGTVFVEGCDQWEMDIPIPDLPEDVDNIDWDERHCEIHNILVECADYLRGRVSR